MILYALDITCRRLHIYSSEVELKENCEGLSIAEGDWLFFSEDGSPLEALFSKPARINPNQNTYSNGEYSLRPSSGDRLETKFQYVEFINGHAVLKDIIYEQGLEESLNKSDDSL